MTQIISEFFLDGVLTNATSAKLSDPTAAYGVRVTGVGTVVVADDTAMTPIATGRYSHSFADPSPGLTYEYYVEFVFEGETYHFPGSIASEVEIGSVSGDTFTTSSEIERWLSQQGKDLRLDDLSLGDKTVMMTEVIEYATEIMTQYVYGRYDVAEISTSPWVRRRASVIAAHLLCLRRGNASPFADFYQTIIDELKGVMSYMIHIPSVNARNYEGPSSSNYIIDQRGLAPVQLVDQRSRVGSYPGQITSNNSIYPYP